jgi:GNAT superfamily N-acetyltransferase
MRFRQATHDDLPAIVAMLADDELGQTRERPGVSLADEYVAAFDAICRQEGNEIILAVDGDEVIGCLQYTLIPGLSRLGMLRAQIESVRVSREHLGSGVGMALFRHAIERATADGCGLVQLTTDNARPDALRFYERLGFVASHAGMKLTL